MPRACRRVEEGVKPPSSNHRALCECGRGTEMSCRLFRASAKSWELLNGMIQSSSFVRPISGSGIKSPRTALAPLCPSADLSDVPDVQPHEGVSSARLVLVPSCRIPLRSARAARGTSCVGLGRTAESIDSAVISVTSSGLDEALLQQSCRARQCSL